MKFFNLAVASIAALATLAPSANAAGLVVRAVNTDSNTHPYGVCDAYDATIKAVIDSAILQVEAAAAQGPARALRAAGRSLGQCHEMCQDVWPGTCFVAYPGCDAPTPGTAKTTAEEDALLPEDTSLTCFQATIAIQAAMENLANTNAGLSDACKAALRDHSKAWKCFNQN